MTMKISADETTWMEVTMGRDTRVKLVTYSLFDIQKRISNYSPVLRAFVTNEFKKIDTLV